MAHTFETEAKNSLQKWWWKLRSLQGYRYQTALRDMETMVLFIGYPRSGHTLIGSMLDAHPDMVVSHELDALYFVREQFSLPQLFHEILRNSRRFTAAGRQWEGYHYQVPDQWQGRFRQLRVIGDKCGGRTSHRLKLRGSTDLMYQAQKLSGGKLKLLHVIRNPYDNISTMARRTAKRKGAPLREPLLKRQMRFYFDRCRIIDEIRRDGRIPVLDVHQASFVQSPAAGLETILRFLDLEATPDYLKSCVSLVWDNPHPSRHKIRELWTPAMQELVQEKMAPYDFLQPYTFESD